MPGQVGVLLPAISHAHAHRNGMESTQNSPVELAFYFPIPRLPPPVFVHHETYAGIFGQVHNLPTLFQGWSQRLLTNDVYPFAGRQLRHFQMRFRRGDDVDEVRLGLVQKFFEVCPRAYFLDPIPLGNQGGFIHAAITDRCNSDLRNSFPGFVLEVAEVTGSHTYSL